MATTSVSPREGEYLLIEAELPGKGPETVGVLLYDPAEERIGMRLRRDWREFAAEPEAEVLELLARDLESKAAEFGANEFLAWIETTLSNLLRVSERRPLRIGWFEASLNRLYHESVPSKVLPYLTHLPVYSLRAAAGRWGEPSPEEIEPQAWIEAPVDLRPTEGMFVARVAGRSMENVIPDGAWCIFRAPVVGSRQNKLVLVINRDEAEEGGLRYTVKRYRSEKGSPDPGSEADSWEHKWIRFEPLNPDYPAWEAGPTERISVIAEFIRLLDGPGRKFLPA